MVKFSSRAIRVGALGAACAAWFVLAGGVGSAQQPPAPTDEAAGAVLRIEPAPPPQ